VPRVLVAPVASGLVGRTPGDHRTHARHGVLEVGGNLAGGLATCLLLVGPRPAEHPVVQALPALAEALAGAVVRARDVAVDRRGDSSDDLGHPSAHLPGRETAHATRDR